MAKKSKRRAHMSQSRPRRQHAPPGQPPPQPPPKRQQAAPRQQRWRQKTLLGGVILALVLGIGVFLRYYQQRQLPPRLQGAIDNHYTHGVAGAPVVVKEFSDYG
jgi:hypothetical protein